MRQKQVGLKYGFRSGLESRVAAQLDALGVTYRYEELTLMFTQPVKKRRYTPDFELFKTDGNPMIVETKGRFLPEDRKKMKLIGQQFPDLDIRFVFSNPKGKIYKGSKTTYGDWCDKNGFKYAKGNKGTIPEEWLEECMKE